MRKRDKGTGHEDFSYRPYRAPEATPARRAEMNKAAAAHVEANRSDPFSRGRVMLHMRRGLAAPSEVLVDATAQRTARERAAMAAE